MKKTRRITSIILALSLMLTSLFGLGFNVFAEIRYFERGVLTDGENTAYYLIDKDNKVLYLTGDGENSGKTPDYPSAAEGPFAGRTDVTRIVIEEDVERVGDYVFANMTSVDTLEIQSTLLKDTSMSTKALIGCTSLSSIQGDSTLLSTDVLVQVVKGALNVASGNWLALAMNVINIGKEGFTSDNNLENDTIHALVDDYINTEQAIYFGELSTVTEAYEERLANPCYENKTFNHNYESAVTAQPTCEDEGTITYTCTKCGDVYTEPIDALGHIYVEDILYEPTCTKRGVKEYVCTRCDDVKLTPITALGHTPEVMAAVEATCAQTGLTQGSKCSVCGEILTPQETIDALPHTFSYSYDAQSDVYTAVCDECGYSTDSFNNDTEALISAVNYAKSFDSSKYTEESYGALYQAAVKYYNLTENDELKYPQYAIDEKTSEILTKITELAPYLKLTVTTTTGGSALINVNNQDIPAPTGLTVGFGETVTLTATPNDNYVFTGWYETTINRYLSNDLTYTFKMSSNTDIKACFVKSTLSTLSFKNDTGQIVKTVSKTPTEWGFLHSIDALLPSVPYKYGYTNGTWSYNSQTVLGELQAGRDVDVIPTYDSLGVTLPEQPVSDDGVTPKITLSYELVQVSETKYTGSFIMAADIPNESRIVEIGTALYKQSASEFNPLEFDLNLDNKTLTSKYNGIEDSGIYITNMNGITARYNWAARGYITYYNDEGKLATVYSNQINVINRQAV